MNKPPTIDELASMDDASLYEAFGFAAKLAEAKESLTKLATLEGAARKEAENRVRNMLSPTFYPSELSYIYDDLKKKRSGKEELAATPSPSDI